MRLSSDRTFRRLGPKKANQEPTAALEALTIGA